MCSSYDGATVFVRYTHTHTPFFLQEVASCKPGMESIGTLILAWPVYITIRNSLSSKPSNLWYFVLTVHADVEPEETTLLCLRLGGKRQRGRDGERP